MRGGSNEYSQSMFWNKNKNLVNPSFTIYCKSGVHRV